MLHLNLGQDVDCVTGPRIHLWRGSAEVCHPAQSPLLDGLTIVEIKGDLRLIDKFHSSEGFSCFYSTLMAKANMTDKAAAELRLNVASWSLFFCLIVSLPLSVTHGSSSRVSSILRESSPHFPSHEPLGSPCQQWSYLWAAPFL